ncbi:hypothetical protein ACP70R_041992 [Stipagrostis hirtigluma subsp. patula]
MDIPVTYDFSLWKMVSLLFLPVLAVGAVAVAAVLSSSALVEATSVADAMGDALDATFAEVTTVVAAFAAVVAAWTPPSPRRPPSSQGLIRPLPPPRATPSRPQPPPSGFKLLRAHPEGDASVPLRPGAEPLLGRGLATPDADATAGGRHRRFRPSGRSLQWTSGILL